MPDDFYRDQEQDELDGRPAELARSAGRRNELRVTYQRDPRPPRQPGSATTPFPFVTRRCSRAGHGAGRARENFSTANELDQDICELNDDFTLMKGKHTFTFGTHNEFFKFRNLFIRDNFGNYRFASLGTARAGPGAAATTTASRATSDPLQAAKFSVRQFGFYAGDQWRAAHEHDADLRRPRGHPDVPDKPTANPVSVSDVRLRAPTSCPARVDVVAARRLQLGSQRATTPSRCAAASASSRAARRTSGCRTSTATPASSSRSLSVAFNANNRIPFVADPRTADVGAAHGRDRTRST